MTLDAYLATRSDRCAHGFHVRLQGCTDCGVALKFAGMAQASAARPSDRAAVDAAIRTLAATGRPFSANQARALHGVKGGVVGAAFNAAHKSGLIKPCQDDVTSTGGSAHGHRIFQWVGAAA